MNEKENIEDSYIKQIVSMGYTEDIAKDYIDSQKNTEPAEIDPNLGLQDNETIEVKLPEINDTVFSSSSSKLLLPSEKEINPYARGLAVLLLIGCLAGFLNGIDFLSPNSGMNRPHELIYAQSLGAPKESAIFLGTVTLEDGSPAEDYTIHIRSSDGGKYHITTVDSNGEFRMENLTPGLSKLDISFTEGDSIYGITHRILLSPPAGFEPYGFTQIDLKFPEKSEFGSDNGTSVFWIDYSSKEMEFPLIDPSAATGYTIAGYGIAGLALLAALFSVIAFNTGNVGIIRTTSVLVFFSMGHLYSSCCIGIVVFMMTFMIDQKE